MRALETINRCPVTVGYLLRSTKLSKLARYEILKRVLHTYTFDIFSEYMT